MAITAADGGKGNNNSSNQSWTGQPSKNFAQNSFAVLVVAANNSSSGGSTNDMGLVTDSIGNFWTGKYVSAVLDVTAANTGLQLSVYLCPMKQGALQTGTVITMRNTTACVAKAWVLVEVIPTSSSYYIVPVDKNTANLTGGTAPTITSSSVTSGNIIIGFCGNEYGTEQTINTPDADTSNGSWSTVQYDEVGSAAAGMNCCSQYKVVTGTGTQTYNLTYNSSTDSIIGWVVLTEVAYTASAVRDMIRETSIPFPRKV